MVLFLLIYTPMTTLGEKGRSVLLHKRQLLQHNLLPKPRPLPSVETAASEPWFISIPEELRQHMQHTPQWKDHHSWRIRTRLTVRFSARFIHSDVVRIMFAFPCCCSCATWRSLLRWVGLQSEQVQTGWLQQRHASAFSSRRVAAAVRLGSPINTFRHCQLGEQRFHF